MRLAWQSFGPALLVALGWAALAWQHPPALYMSSGSLSARHSAMLTESKHFIYSIKSNHIMCYSQHDTGNTATANAEHRDEFVRSLPGVNQTTHLSTHLPHLSSKRMWSPLGNSRCWSSVAVVLMTLMIAGGVWRWPDNIAPLRLFDTEHWQCMIIACDGSIGVAGSLCTDALWPRLLTSTIIVCVGLCRDFPISQGSVSREGQWARDQT